MDEKKLQGFVRIVENKSMTRAAETLFTTPPALMRQMDTLESELNCKLLLRSPSGCIPTEAGQLLYDRIVPVLSELQSIKEQVSSLRRADPFLKICTPDVCSLPLLDAFSERVLELCPDIQIQYIAASPAKWISLVKSGAADCCMLSAAAVHDLQKAGLAYEKIGPRQLVCLMTASHPLSGKKSLRMDDLANQYVCMDFGTYKLFENMLKPLPLTFRFFQNELRNSEVYNWCRKKRLFFTVSPYNSQFHQLISVPVDLPATEYGWGVRKKQSDNLKKLVRVSREVNDEIF